MMKKIIQTSIIFSFILFTGIISANTIQNTYNWKVVKKADGVKITSSAIYNDGLSAIFGDSAGHIFSANRSGITKYNAKPATGSIDSIVETADSNGLGNFTFTSDGRVYTHNAKSNTNTQLNFPSNSNGKLVLHYDVNDGLCCTVLADNANSSTVTYYYNGNNWKAVKEQNSNGLSNSNLCGNLSYPINSSQSNQLSIADNSPSSQNLNAVYNDHGRFTWTTDGEIKAYFDTAPQTLDATVEPVSLLYTTDTSTGETKPYAAVYRITVRGQGLDQNQLFVNGYNAVRFNLSLESDSSGNTSLNSYESTAHPILGYRYIDDVQGKTAALNPRNISFLWKGPICSKAGQYQLGIKEYVRDTQKKDEQYLSGKTISLPVVSEATSTSYQIEIETTGSTTAATPTVTCCPNGVSATPFKVVIKDGTTPLSASDDIYNHLVFYLTDGSSTCMQPADAVIGCNPYDSNSDDLSILPEQVNQSGQKSESVMIDGKKKYGPKPVCFPDQGGRTFYLTAGSGVNTNWKIGVAAPGYIASDKQLCIATMSTDVAPSPNNDKSDLNSGSRVITLYSGEVEQEISSWEGTSTGDETGYLDYTLRDTADPDSQGIYAIFPQGLNTLDIDSRLDPAAMQVGYYIQPGGKSDGLHASEYNIDDKTSFCDTLKGKNLHACLFDRYGRIARYAVDDNVDTNGNAKYWDKPIHDNYTHMLLTNWSNIPICVHSNDEDLGVSEYDKGVFLPPDPEHKNQGVTFTTKHTSKVTNDSRTLKVRGDELCSANSDPDHYDYFESELQYWDSGNMEIEFKNFLYLPGHIKDLINKKKYSDLYLPVNQDYLYNHENWHICLEYWGVHFVEYDRACDVGTSTSKYRFRGKDNDDKQWVYSLAGHYETAARYEGIYKESVTDDYMCPDNDLIHDYSIEGTHNKTRILQIAADTPDPV